MLRLVVLEELDKQQVSQQEVPRTIRMDRRRQLLTAPSLVIMAARAEQALLARTIAADRAAAEAVALTALVPLAVIAQPRRPATVPLAVAAVMVAAPAASQLRKTALLVATIAARKPAAQVARQDRAQAATPAMPVPAVGVVSLPLIMLHRIASVVAVHKK